MNSTMLQGAQDRFAEYFVRNFIVVVFGTIINCINGIFVFTFFRSSIFYNDPRYILYIHLVINDMLMVFMTVVLFVMAYAWSNVPVPFCILLLIISSTTHKNTPLTLAGMAIERYIAICKPLHHSHICTVRRTYILIFLIWGVGVIPALTDLVVFGIVLPISIFTKGALCSSANLYSTPYHTVISKCTHGLYTSAVWLILLFTYVRVLVTAKRATSDKSSAKKAQSTILLHGIQLLLCMLSYITPLIDRIYVPLIPSEQKKIVFFHYLLTNMAPRLLSPLIYGVRDQHLYKHVKGLFTCRILIVKVKATK
ncbi:odorant receptor 131-2-like [Triplophysa rosa]|uniref:Odorant receptor n=1 Tax=Triplophysa rosa TaxID=992332 RepID=A0A9W7WS02_TRIRA|nr:odorant receptor 131-2-like [Triplophysa rosa]KAI7807480.1 odorant receptor [Triplophysa rosa]